MLTGTALPPRSRPLRRAGQPAARSEQIADVSRLEQDCYEAYNIQVSGLAQRLRATGLQKVVIGISGASGKMRAAARMILLNIVGLPLS